MPNTKIIARPWQPQDLIDDLQGIIDEECDNYLNTRRTTLCMARDYLKEYFAEMKWIPVEDEQKPKDRRNDFIAYVFGDSDMHFFGEAKYHAYEGNGVVDRPHFSNEGVNEMRVTHWMEIPKLPLPQPPKGE